VGVTICEDIWYPSGPMNLEALEGGAEVIINISASPYHAGKGLFRKRMLSTRAADNVVIVAFNNLVGGQDELVFDGNGMIFDQNGELIASGKQFEEDLIATDLDIDAVYRRRLLDPRHRKERFLLMTNPSNVKKLELSPVKTNCRTTSIERKSHTEMNRLEEVYNALVLGTGDYVRKNGFAKVLIGLSGGIDSSLTVTIAVDALGKENVVGVSMPSQYSSDETKSDAQRLAENLGIKFIVVPIIDIFESYLKTLKDAFEGLEMDITEENIQARIRGNILMALSNKFGYLVLTTGNKSEMSVGYCTLYGDMAGGFAVIKDVPKTLVYELASYKNSLADKDIPGLRLGLSAKRIETTKRIEIIPQSVIDRAPSAELRPEQKDTDSLPPYETLDAILQAYVEEEKSPDDITNMRYDESLVKRVIRMVDRSEYKRRQGPPGIKITPKAFGKDRRLPITNKYN